MRGPFMLPMALLPSQVDEHRRLDCRHHRRCVDQAARLNWPGMSCQGCDAFESTAMEQREAVDQVAQRRSPPEHMPEPAHQRRLAERRRYRRAAGTW
jgi:hypothetical protein